jgi:Peptidase family S41
MTRAVVAMVLVGMCVARSAMLVAAPSAYDSKPWLEDLEQTRQAFSTKYANLEWAVMEREINLESLFSDAKDQIQSAASDADARAAFDRLARRLGDGHVRFRWTKEEAVKLARHANCGALGYDARIRGGDVATLMPGYTPLLGAPAKEFAAGTLQIAGRRVGVIEIGIFTPEGMPELCADALAALKLPPESSCDEACKDRVDTWVSNRMTLDLAAQLRAVENAKAEVLLIDIANNGGGTQWSEAAVRMVSGIRLKSERVGFVRGPHWAKHFADTVADLRADAKRASPSERKMLNGLAETVLGYQHEAESPCDSGTLWQGKEPSCRWLGEGFYSSGVLDSADPNALKGKSWAEDVFTPMEFPYEEGVWRGPVVVLVNARTGSAAEQFAAILQDNHAAVIMGAPTGGAGCGHTNGGTPTTLTNSGAILELPDCARIRADGSNEVMGIQPDVLVGLRTTDGPHRQGIRAAGKLPEAVERALKLAAAPAGN